MVKNMKQVNRMLENVNQQMNTAELARVMDKFEQVRIIFLTKKNHKIIFFI
jgi:division protein CdvB (Snf7/Vps24/ESCRT-III family)